MHLSCALDLSVDATGFIITHRMCSCCSYSSLCPDVFFILWNFIYKTYPHLISTAPHCVYQEPPFHAVYKTLQYNETDQATSFIAHFIVYKKDLLHNESSDLHHLKQKTLK